MTPSDLVMSVFNNGECGTWEKVARFLAEYGPAHVGAYWRLIAVGEIKKPNWRSVNTLRLAQNPPLPPLAPSIEYAVESGAQYAIQADDEPDTALLVNLEGRAPESISIKTADIPLPQATERPAARISAGLARKRRAPRCKISYSAELGQEMQELRKKLGESWEEFGRACFEARLRELRAAPSDGGAGRGGRKA